MNKVQLKKLIREVIQNLQEEELKQLNPSYKFDMETDPLDTTLNIGGNKIPVEQIQFGIDYSPEDYGATITVIAPLTDIVDANGKVVVPAYKQISVDSLENSDELHDIALEDIKSKYTSAELRDMHRDYERFRRRNEPDYR